MNGVKFFFSDKCNGCIVFIKTMKNYFDEYNFMDIQLYSSYGFDDQDVKALRKSKNVDDIFATKFVDVFVRNDEDTIVTRVQETESSVNKYELCRKIKNKRSRLRERLFFIIMILSRSLPDFPWLP